MIVIKALFVLLLCVPVIILLTVLAVKTYRDCMQGCRENKGSGVDQPWRLTARKMVRKKARK